ncbi:major facilitator superfamily domain-containing protein [Leptodontidium sp. MPI-SDFR-AT-0119]|nr:major facilitator superfamily domain-containing protein [Leptodontidium sp. MPI-SDFR-AT-0119]
MTQKKTKYSISNSWSIFTSKEKRNIVIYVLGIMLYKFGIEAFNGSMIALATSRYDREAGLAGKPARTFERVGLLTGLNQACRCLGSMLVTPLIRKNPTKTVISGAVLAFGVLTAVLLIVDASTGGTIKPRGWDKMHTTEDLDYYGTYNTDVMIPFYCFTGLAYGMVETIRRVIAKDIVGGNIQKLLRMDSIVHIFYEISGTGGALTTSLVLIPYLGNNMSFIITPILLAAASIVWRLITAPPTPKIIKGLEVASLENDSKRSVTRAILEGLLEGVVVFFKSLALGIKILISSRRYIWLLPGYSLALYSHRFLENNISTVIAQRYLGDAAWSQIMVAGSNFGELLGALFVFLFTTLIHTPLPWIRLDSLMLSIVWFLAFWRPADQKMSQAWIVAGAFTPLSFGWAAGDVSLVAYVQSQLQGEEERSGGEYDGISPLSAVMSCLYSTYIVLYAIMSPLLGSYIDGVYKRRNDVHEAVKYVAGVQYSVIAGIILVATFVPKGSFAFNPKKLNGDITADDEETTERDNEANARGFETSPSQEDQVGDTSRTV